MDSRSSRWWLYRRTGRDYKEGRYKRLMRRTTKTQYNQYSPSRFADDVLLVNPHLSWVVQSAVINVVIIPFGEQVLFSSFCPSGTQMLGWALYEVWVWNRNKAYSSWTLMTRWTIGISRCANWKTQISPALIGSCIGLWRNSKSPRKKAGSILPLWRVIDLSTTFTILAAL